MQESNVKLISSEFRREISTIPQRTAALVAAVMMGLITFVCSVAALTIAVVKELH